MVRIIDGQSGNFAQQRPREGTEEHRIHSYGFPLIVHLCAAHSDEHEAMLNEMPIEEWEKLKVAIACESSEEPKCPDH